MPPGTEVDIEKKEALSLIERGLAELPAKEKSAAEKAAAEAATKNATDDSANGLGGGE